MQFLPLLLLSASAASAQLFSSSSSASPDLSTLNLEASVTFPTPSPGLQTLLNGDRTPLTITLMNKESAPVTVEYVGGSLWDADKSVKNFTSVKLATPVKPDSTLQIPYPLNLDMAPRELLLNLALIITTAKGDLVTVTAYNQTVAVVDGDMGIFDPGMLFLYTILAAGLASAAYFVYNTWVASVAPQKRRAPRPERVVPVAAPVSATGAKYDESWIPEHHLKKGGKGRARTPKSG
ncbi:hypothetical protein EDC01DRAFT_7303 [Geopyxis carbonaria]|nr:hypothetical protein EDC01DRAFT_7303 [Geopyxis carbonaria]